MHVFVTGATGWIGRAVIPELLSAGHTVSGLARSDEGASLVSSLGATVVRGSLADPDVLKESAAAADAVIHLAFIHDFTNFQASCAADRAAIEAFGAALAGSHRPLLITSGTLMLPRGTLATEDMKPDTANPMTALRGQSEALALSLVARGVRANVVRLAPTNHGPGDKGFIPNLINIAREKRAAAYVASGANRWPAVHRLDTARLYRLALERGAAGAIYHAVADEGVPLKAIAEAIAKGAGVPVVSKAVEEAPEHFGWMAMVVGEDNPVSSRRTQEELGWKPREKSLLEDLASGFYFEG